MRTNSSFRFAVAIVTAFLSVVGSAQAVPPAPAYIPDTAATGMLFGVALCGLGILKRWIKP